MPGLNETNAVCFVLTGPSNVSATFSNVWESLKEVLVLAFDTK